MAWPGDAKRGQIPDPDELCLGKTGPQIHSLPQAPPSKALTCYPPSFLSQPGLRLCLLEPLPSTQSLAEQKGPCLAGLGGRTGVGPLSHPLSPELISLQLHTSLLPSYRAPSSMVNKLSSAFSLENLSLSLQRTSSPGSSQGARPPCLAGGTALVLCTVGRWPLKELEGVLQGF